MGKNKCCLNCQERVLGCHSECEKYAEYKKELAEFKEKRNKVIYNEMDNYKYERHTRFVNSFNDPKYVAGRGKSM